MQFSSGSTFDRLALMALTLIAPRWQASDTVKSAADLPVMRQWLA